MLAVPLMLVPKLLVTGSSGEGIEEDDSCKTASRTISQRVEGLKVKAAELILSAT